MASQDQKNNLIELFKQQPQLIFIAVLAVLLVVRILIFLNESSFTGGQQAKPTIITLKPKLTIDSPEYTNVNNLLPPEEVEPLSQSKYKVLVETDVFDFAQVESAVANRSAADKKVSDGYAALGRDDLVGAESAAEESLKLVANNRGALALKRDVAAKYVEAGYAALKAENKDLDGAREDAKKALEIVPDFDKALELQKAIEEAANPGRGRATMAGMPGGLPGVLPGAAPTGSNLSTTGTTAQGQ